VKTARVPFALLGLTLFAVGLSAEEGMWMPQQISEMGAKLKALGFQGDPKRLAILPGSRWERWYRWAAARPLSCRPTG
jgi:hypothetical protein